MDKQQVVAILGEIADLMEIQGANPFRVRSFRNGARALESLDEDLGARAEAGDLVAIPGIGKTLAALIEELYATGEAGTLAELRDAVPSGLVDMVAIPGVGPKKVRILHEALELSDVDALEAACKEGRVAGVKGFGPKTEKRILEGIAYRRQVQGRFLVVEARHAAELLVEHLRGAPEVKRLEVAGSLRRWRETVKDIDIIVAVDDAATAPAVMKHFAAFGGVAEVIAMGETKASVRLSGGLQSDLRVVDLESFPFALQYFTGSKEHNTALRALAQKKGLKLNEYGLFKSGGEERRLCADEQEIYAELGLDWIPPELREQGGELELAAAHDLPDLLKLEDLRGVVHVHTRYSDGKESLEEMAEAARDRGFEYLGISDHSQSAGYAGGLKVDAIRRQHEEIDRLNEKLDGFRIFKGIESDIRLDGSLDYPDDVLDSFDFIIASIHSGFQLPEEEQTRRVIRAMEDPHTTFLAHPTGRLLLARDSYAINMEKVLEAAGRLDVIVEINANPRRLDLDWRWGSFARRHGVRTAIHPDAHHSSGYDDVVYGVAMARKAGFSASEVANTRGEAEFEALCGARKIT